MRAELRSADLRGPVGLANRAAVAGKARAGGAAGGGAAAAAAAAAAGAPQWSRRVQHGAPQPSLLPHTPATDLLERTQRATRQQI